MLHSKTVNGRNANRISFGHLNNTSTTLGHYRQIGLDTWEELNASNSVSFRFKETHRDDWSVYLHDASRNVYLQLDLHRKIIVYSHGNTKFDLYSILSSASKINGWTANQASFASLEGRPLGQYLQTGKKTWTEFGKTGTVNFIFEEIHRDDWSIYLRDTSRNVRIQIDLHRQKIIYSDSNRRFDLYSVTGATSYQKEAYLTPSVTGQTVNLLDFGHPNGVRLGQYKQTGPLTWIEMDKNNKVTFYFTETKRHNGSIFLFDPSRGVTLELSISSNKIIYSDTAANRFELYTILKSYTKINGWVGNLVRFRSLDETAPLGTYRQTGEYTWEELNFEQKLSFRFKEVQRDDWSVYLRDDSRNVNIQIDFHTQKVVYSDADRRFDLYSIERASSDPYNIIPVATKPVKSRNVRSIDFGALNGKPLGTYRQTGPSTWAEVGVNGKVNFTFNEAKERDHNSVYLHDPSRNVSLQINLDTHRIIYTDAIRTFTLYTVLHSSPILHGWVVSEVSFGSIAGEALGHYRQTSPNAWAEFNKSGNVNLHFNEVRREDWAVYLHDPSRDVSLKLDLRDMRIIYGDSSKSGIYLYKILNDSIESDVWLHSEKITSRSSLTEDFDVNRGAAQLNPKPVYRTSVSLSSVTTYVDVWASEETAVEINGTRYIIDPVKSARVQPNRLSKLSISVPATSVRCPKLILRTNLMMPDHRHYIYPDVEAHKKIVGLKDGALYKAKNELGISDHYSKEDVDHFQRALKNIAKTVQHTYNKTPHGVHHDRALHPKNMEHPHFMVDFDNKSARYRVLHPSEVPQINAGARVIQVDAAQNIFSDIGHFFVKATKVVVHTVENVGKDIVQTVENVGSDVVHTVHQVGEDIIHGDIDHIGQDLLQGGESIGSDLVKGAGNVVGDVVSGAGQLVVMTLHAADEAVQFVLSHTGFVGHAIQWLFKKIGAEAAKVVNWFLDKIGWGDVLHTHDALFNLFNSKIEEAKAYPEMLKQRADKFFTHLTNVITDDIDKAIDHFDVLEKAKQPQPVASHSGAVEKIEWLLGKLAHHASGANSLSFSASSATQNSMFGGFANLIEEQLGKDGGKIMGAIEQAVGDVGHIFTDPKHTPEYLLGALLEIVKAVAIISLDALKVILDALLDLIEALLVGFKDMMNAPWDIPFISDLYGVITEGRQMSFLSFTCLLIAIPATIISKAEFDTPPFSAQGASSTLDPLSNIVRDSGIVYGVCHIILAPIAIVVNAKSALSAISDGLDKSLNETFNIPNDPNPAASLSKFDLLMDALNAGIGFVAQFMGNPIPPGESYSMPLDHAKDDVFEAPGYWGHVIWWFQWAGWSVNTIAAGAVHLGGGAEVSEKWTKGAGNVIAVFNTAWGIAHMALMGVLDQADRKKRDGLSLLDASYYSNLPPLQLFQELERQTTEKHGHQPYWTFTDETTENNGVTVVQWVGNVRNYYAWAKDVSPGKGIPNKGFGNVMDTFPEIGQLGAMPAIVEGTEGLSLIGTAFFDLLGHLGEGITFLVRVDRNALL